MGFNFSFDNKKPDSRSSLLLEERHEHRRVLPAYKRTIKDNLDDKGFLPSSPLKRSHVFCFQDVGAEDG